MFTENESKIVSTHRYLKFRDVTFKKRTISIYKTNSRIGGCEEATSKKQNGN